MLVTFTPSRRLELLHLAQRRDAKRYEGVVNQLVSERLGSQGANVLAVCAEAAVAELLGVPMDTRILKGGRKTGYALVWQGKTVMVRCNTHEALLYLNDRAAFRADLGVLCMPRGKSAMDVVAWISRDDYLRQAFAVHFGRGIRWPVCREQMRDIAELVRPAAAQLAMW